MTRILLADDEASVRMTLAANLELEGFEVETAEDGQRALELFGEKPFDLVLTDIRMPRMDGVQLFQEIRRREPGMPVVLMSGFALEDLVDHALTHGAFALLPKPFEVEHVVAVVTSAARRPVVLVVDGDEARATAEALRALGVAAIAGDDEETTVRVIEERRADVCVTELTSADGGALDMACRLLSRAPSLTWIAVSARDAHALVRRAAALGAFACFARPVEAAELARAVARARAARRRAEPPAAGGVTAR
jgi:DNA-binding NtrC family response regulator